MHPQTRATLGFSALAAAGCLVWLYRHDRGPAATAPPPPRPRIVAPAPPAPPPPPPPALPSTPERMSKVAVGEIDLAWLPKGFVREPKRIPEMPDFDESLERTSELAAYVDGWLTDNSTTPRIAYRRGVIFAESTEDRGDDGPYPRSAGIEGMRVCGTQAIWLRTQLREQMSRDDVVCSKNVCAFGGMEYMPRSYVVFHHEDGEWYLDAWANVFYATLRDDIAEKNYRDTANAMRHVASGCPGEPAGAY